MVTITNKKTGKKFKKEDDTADRIKNSKIGKQYSFDKKTSAPDEVKSSDKKTADKTSTAAPTGTGTPSAK